MTLKELKSYRILSERHVPELNSDAIILRHNKTDAKVFVLSNDDENKVFNIGFRTPPSDSTGVPHIMEHSVLCGSEKFPVKDPFVELVKGSLNTFLNAMTYPDMTVYPIASCNDKDFQNLMDVYLDAVFHPNIYKNEKIFRQEGWHYEAEDKDSEITINGVVYNEMKGAFSSPEGVLDRYTQEVLYPDTCYTFESGGDPEDIPNLTYEAFLDFHRKFYHPSNSFIYLYGNMDMAEKLDYIDREYLSKYDYRKIDSEITRQKPFEKAVEKEIFYPITEEESEENATYLSYNTVVGDSLDPKLYMAFQVLEYLILSSPGAILKKALIDAGIGEDIMGNYESGVLQPYFSIIAKNANKEQKDEFLRIIDETLKNAVKNGFNRKSIQAAINYYEFRYREADYGSAPTGLMYGLEAMDSWLYDEDPVMHLEYEDTFAFLKANIDTGYFEKLTEEYLIGNPHSALIIVSPKKNYTAIQDDKLREKLAEFKKSLTEEEIQKIVDETVALKEYQDSEDDKEDLEKIPLLERSDINPEPEDIMLEEREAEGVKVLYHNYFTSGISYIKTFFSTEAVPNELLPYVGLLKTVLGYVDTDKHTYGDLSDDINLYTGGMNVSTMSSLKVSDPEKFARNLCCSMRVLNEKVDAGFDIIEEVVTGSKLDDTARLKEIIAEIRSRLQMRFSSSGHSSAISHALSYFSPSSRYAELLDGIDYYNFIENIWKNYDEMKAEVSAKLAETARLLFTADNMIISFTGDADGYANMETALKKFKAALPAGNGIRYEFEFTPDFKNEGFMTSSQVNFVARCGNYRPTGLKYTGALKTLKVILGYDYLWLNVRVKGGAYGVMNGFGRSGEGYFVSYRDPNVRETDNIFLSVADYIEKFDCDDRDMTKYVIGTISDMDVPLLPQYKGTREDGIYFSELTQDMLRQERKEVLEVTQADIRALAPYIRAVLETGSVCAIGNSEKIKASADMFKEVKNLLA